MLIEAIRYMKGDKLTYGRIYGQEKNLATSAIARMNLFLHGAKDFEVVQGDTLRSPRFLENEKLKTFEIFLRTLIQCPAHGSVENGLKQRLSADLSVLPKAFFFYALE